MNLAIKCHRILIDSKMVTAVEQINIFIFSVNFYAKIPNTVVFLTSSYIVD